MEVKSALRKSILRLAGMGLLAAIVLLLSAQTASAQEWEVTWSQEPAVAVAGQPLLVRVQVHNTSGSDVTADTSFYAWSSGLTARDWGSKWSGCSADLSAPSVSCEDWTFEVEDTFEWFLLFDVPPDYVTSGGSRAIQFYYQHSDGDTLDTSHGVQVNALADLRITKFVEPEGTVRAGDTFTYTIFVDNLGPSFARNVVITDTLLSSANVTVQTCAFSVSQGGGAITQFSCTTGAVGSTQFGTDVGRFRTNQLEPLTATSQGRLRASFRLKANEAIDVTNTVRTASLTPDPDLTNNLATVSLSVTDVADLMLSKTVVTSPVMAGGTASWTVRITNIGPSAAENVQLIDLLPAGLVDGMVDFGATACTGGTPGNPLDPLVCPVGTLASGASWSLQISAMVDPAFVLNQPDAAWANYLVNDAWVTSDTFDPRNSNNRFSAAVEVDESADLSLVKYAIGTPVAGGEIHYEVQVHNDGPSWSEDVTLRDFLPGDLEFLSAFVDYENGLGTVPLACNLAAGSNGLFCPLGDIPPTGANPILVFVNGRIEPDATGELVNGADVNFRDTPDPDPTNNYMTIRTELNYNADVDIVKSSEPAVVYAGEQKKYTVTVTNHGPSTIYNAELTDPLPPGVVYEADDASCDLPGGVVTCDLGEMAPGASRMVTIWARVDAALLGPIENTACVGWMLGNSTEHRACDTTQNVVQGKVDLRIVKFGKPDGEVRAGENLTYTILVDNLGPGVAHAAKLTDLMRSSGTFYPAGTAYTSDRLMACALTAAPWVEEMRLECTLDDPLEVGGRWQLTLYVTADETQDINNVADVSSDDFDPDLGNNHAEVGHAITDVADLAVTKAALGEVQMVGQPGGVFDIRTPGTSFPRAPSYTTSATEVTAGRRILYTLTVTNNGPSTAENVVLSDRLPAGVQIYPSSLTAPAGVHCATGTPGEPLDRLVCGLGTIPAGEPRVISFQVVVDPSPAPGTVLENDAYAISDLFDPDNGDNYAHTQTIVNTWADMSVTKSAVGEVVTGCDPVLGTNLMRDLPNEVTAGKTLRYEVTVQNNGASDAANVQVMDVLPDLVAGSESYAVTFLRAVGAACRPDDDHALWTVLWPGSSATGQAVFCELGAVPAGARRTFELYVAVNPAVADGAVLDNGALVLFGPSSPPAQPPSLFPGSPAFPPALPVTNDPFTGDNFVVQETEVRAAADLLVEKWSEPVKVYAGEQKKYVVRVSNLGSSVAQEVVVADTLPPEVAYEIATGPCSAAGQVVSCDLGALGPGQVWELEIWVRVRPETVPGTTILNSVVVTSATQDYCVDNNVAESKNLVLGKADLKVVKFGKMDGEVLAGDMLTYTVVVDNLGPGYAHDVELVDLLQSSGTFELVAVTSDRAALCAPESGTFTERLQLSCTLTDALEVQGRWLVTVIATADETQDLNNLAVVYTSDLDPESGNNQAYVEHAITDVSDLNVSKCVWSEETAKWECGDDPVAVVAGETARYRLYLSNTGPSTAQNPVVYDTLPLGTSLVSLDDPGWDCSITQPAAGQTAFSCGYPNLPAGEIVHMTYTVLVDASVPEGTLLVNGAAVTSDLFDPNAQNNYDEMLLKVEVENGLWIEKADEPDPVMAGNRLLYYVEAGNDGPSTAWDMLVWDGLPKQVEFRSVTVVNRSDTVCTYAALAHEINCVTPAVKPGETVWLAIEVRMKPGTAGNTQIHNNAEVWSSAGHAATTEATKVQTKADLGIEKVGEPAKVFADGQVKYTLTVKNGGPSDAQAVVVTDELPGAVKAELLPSECLEVTAGRVECELGSMAAGAERVIELWVRVNANARDGTELYNEACVSGSTTQGDPDAANDCDDATGLVLGQADLAVAKYGPAGPVSAGEELTYRVVVDNLGPGYAHNVVVADLLQSTGEFELVSVASDRAASCAPMSGTFDELLELECELNGVLEVANAGSSGRWIVTIVIRATEAQTLSNVARVRSSDPDPNLGNNQAVAQGAIGSVADLWVEKLASGQLVLEGCAVTTAIDHVTAGLELSYLVTVGNAGPSAAANVVVSDRLPAGIVVTGVTASQGSCQTGTPGGAQDKLTCALGTLAAGDEVEIEVTALVPPSTPAGTVLENDAAVASDAFDLDNSDNGVVNLTTVSAAADLVLSKAQSPAFVMPGDEVTYRLTVENYGPSDAAGAVLSDTLSPLLVEASWECTAFEGASCPAGDEGDLYDPVDLPAGGRLVVTIVATRDQFGAGPALINHAEILAPAGVLDCSLANNGDTVVNELHKVYLPLIPKARDLPLAPDLVVQSVAATSTGVEVVIVNEGNRSVEHPFWVDLYLDPDPLPGAVNEVWRDLALQGMVWGVMAEALPVDPGETLTLMVGDLYYSPLNSRVTWPIAPGTEVWVQVDSWGDPGYGAVMEGHELVGWRYNNIAGPVTVVAGLGEPPRVPAVEPREPEGLPPR